jgi:hypothetical protein
MEWFTLCWNLWKLDFFCSINYFPYVFESHLFHTHPPKVSLCALIYIYIGHLGWGLVSMNVYGITLWFPKGLHFVGLGENIVYLFKEWCPMCVWIKIVSYSPPPKVSFFPMTYIYLTWYISNIYKQHIYQQYIVVVNSSP